MSYNRGDDLPFIVADSPPPDAMIKVVGVGGCGCNSVNYMFEQGATGIESYCINTDAQALKQTVGKCTHSMQIGQGVTSGLGAGSDANKGYASAMEDRSRIATMLEGADLLFIVAGMGGGTGTGASPLIAEIAKGLNVLTVAVVTEPFVFENRDELARLGIDKLKPHVDSIITLSNNKLLERNQGQNRSIRTCFAHSNSVLYEAVTGISNLITQPGMINVDFADLRAIMKLSGRAIIGIGRGHGEHRARLATEYAVDNPLNDDVVGSNVRSMLINIAASDHIPLTLGDYQMVNEIIDQKFSTHGAKKVVGTTVDPSLNGELRVTVIATAFAQTHMQAAYHSTAEANNMTVATAAPLGSAGKTPASLLQPQPPESKVFEFTDWDSKTRH